MNLPMRPTIFILLVTQVRDGDVWTTLGPVFWNRIDAQRVAHNPPYVDRPDVYVQIIEREVRGDMPAPRAGAMAGPFGERADSPASPGPRPPYIPLEEGLP